METRSTWGEMIKGVGTGSRGKKQAPSKPPASPNQQKKKSKKVKYETYA